MIIHASNAHLAHPLLGNRKPWRIEATLVSLVLQSGMHPIWLLGAMLQTLVSGCHRYQINASQEAAARDWAPAARHYLQAARVLPTTGNAYNQLAVLDTCVLLCGIFVHLRVHAAVCRAVLNALSGVCVADTNPLLEGSQPYCCWRAQLCW